MERAATLFALCDISPSLDHELIKASVLNIDNNIVGASWFTARLFRMRMMRGMALHSEAKSEPEVKIGVWDVRLLINNPTARMPPQIQQGGGILRLV